MKSYEIHPYCAAFPDLSGEEFDNLKDDLKYRGQQEPCWVYDKWLLDGKNRRRAMEENKQQVKYEKWEPVSKDPQKIEEEIRNFCISKNLRRRHLSESQRAMVAAKLANGVHGGDRKTAQDQVANLRLDQKTAGKSLNVSSRSVCSAATVLNNGAPEVVKAVEAGTVKVSDAAKVADLPKPEQRKALRAVESGESPTLAKAAEPSLATVKAQGTRTLAGPSYDAHGIEKAFGKLTRSIDDMARVSELNNSPAHKETVGFLSKAFDSFKTLVKQCDAVFARKRK